MENDDKNIQRTIELTRELIHCADSGDLERKDDTCGVLYGIVRDSAYRILVEAERERVRHSDREPVHRQPG